MLGGAGVDVGGDQPGAWSEGDDWNARTYMYIYICIIYIHIFIYIYIYIYTLIYIIRICISRTRKQMLGGAGVDVGGDHPGAWSEGDDWMAQPAWYNAVAM